MRSTVHTLRKVYPFRIVSLTISLLATLIFASGKRMARANSEADELTEVELRMNNLDYAKWPPLFEVVDKQDNAIFEVTSTDLWSAASVIDSGAQDVVSMNADANGGYFSVRTSDGGTKARLGVDKAWAGLRISERGTQSVSDKSGTHDETKDLARLELGGQQGGNFSLKFPAFTGMLAGIGESKAGSGAIVIGDSKGTRRASMFVADGKGSVGIYSGDGTALVALGEAAGNTGGSLVIGNAKGEPRVKMGTNDNRYGAVLTFPGGLPYFPKSGLPGSYMLGCAGGPGCYP